MMRGFRVVKDKGKYTTEGNERIFCKKEIQIGSRISTKEICGTAAQIKKMPGETEMFLRERMQHNGSESGPMN